MEAKSNEQILSADTQTKNNKHVTFNQENLGEQLNQQMNMMDQDDESDEYSGDSDKEIFFNKTVKSMNDEMPEDNHQQFSYSPQKPT